MPTFVTETFGALGAWSWVILGLCLCGLEVLAPGAFLIWVGLAAIATGVVAMLLPMATAAALLVFAALSVAFAILGYRIYGGLSRDATEPGLNRGPQEFIGRDLVLVESIENGEGRARVGDTVWRVTGPDLSAGQRVRVVAVENGVLLRVVAA